MPEQFYDEEIAPKLAEIAKLCTDNGLSFVACVEFDDVLAETSMLAEGHTFAPVLVKAAIRARGNVDNLMIALLRQAVANENAGGSLVLNI